MNKRLKNLKNYDRVHFWLRFYYGKATCCENPNCNHTCKIFNWALKKGCRYEKKRDNFFQLCRSCHSRYDLKKSTGKKLSKLLSGRTIPPEVRKKISDAAKGRKRPWLALTNKKRSMKLLWKGTFFTLKELAELYHIERDTLYWRLKIGNWPLEKALK